MKRLIPSLIAAALMGSAPAQLVINELLYDPSPGNDVNQDGEANTSQDEFVEIVNIGALPLNIGLYEITDFNGNFFRFPFGTIIGSGEAVLVFAGGNPAPTLNGASVFIGAPSLNNSGDTITLLDRSSRQIDQVRYEDNSSDDKSLNRSPELTGDFVPHTTISGSVGTESPGTYITGAKFGNLSSTTILADFDGDDKPFEVENFGRGLAPNVVFENGPDGNYFRLLDSMAFMARTYLSFEAPSPTAGWTAASFKMDFRTDNVVGDGFSVAFLDKETHGENGAVIAGNGGLNEQEFNGQYLNSIGVGFRTFNGTNASVTYNADQSTDKQFVFPDSGTWGSMEINMDRDRNGTVLLDVVTYPKRGQQGDAFSVYDDYLFNNVTLEDFRLQIAGRTGGAAMTLDLDNIKLDVGYITLSKQPTSKEVVESNEVVFSVEAFSKYPLTYQWRKNGIDIEGANSSLLMINDVTLDNEGAYSCSIRDTFSSVQSIEVQLKVTKNLQITSSPTSLEVDANSTVTLVVEASGVGDLNYQWFKDETPLAGTNSQNLFFQSIKPNDSGDYWCIVTDSLSSKRTPSFTLTVKSVLLPNSAGIEFVTVGDPMNPPDPVLVGLEFDHENRGGSVRDAFLISKFEITNLQWVMFLNAIDPLGLYSGLTGNNRTEFDYNVQRAFGEKFQVVEQYSDHPVTNVSYALVQRFANWLDGGGLDNVSFELTNSGAYDLTGKAGSWQGGWRGRQRNPEAKFWIPNQDEWYKAAYYQGPNSSLRPTYGTDYSLFPMGGFEANASRPSSLENVANFQRVLNRILPVGSYPNSLSYYGTADQGGNVEEWLEADPSVSYFLNAGGNFTDQDERLASSNRSIISHTSSDGGEFKGFRVAARLQVPPVILEQPTSLNMPALDTAIFSIEAAQGPLRYQWKKNGIDIQRQISSRLQLNRITKDDEGSYSCLISNSYGSIISDSFSLTVNRITQTINFPTIGLDNAVASFFLNASSTSGLPITYITDKPSVVSIEEDLGILMDDGFAKITATQEGDNIYLPAPSVEQIVKVERDVSIVSGPTSQTVNSLEDVKLTLVAEGPGLLLYQWRKNGVDISGADSASLILSEVTTDDGGVYSCVVRNSFGFIISDEVTLVVNRLSQSINFAPIGEIGDGATEVMLSATSSSGLPVTFSSSQLQIVTIDGNNAGFKGVGSANITASQPGNNVYLPADSKAQAINVTDTLRIISAPTSREVDAKSDVVLTVGAEGRGALNYQWYKDGSPFNGINSPILRLLSVKNNESGSYWCVVSDATSSKQTETFSLVVKSLPQEINFPPLGEVSFAQLQKELNATSTSGLPIRYNSSNPSLVSVTQNGQLKINEVGRVTITAYQNGDLTYERAAPVSRELVVVNDLLISSQPSFQEVSALNEAVFSVEATSRAQVSYQWRKDGSDITGSESRILRLSSVTSDDEGSYSCLVRNSFGSVQSSEVTLTVNKLPQTITFNLVDEVSEDFSEIPLNASVDSELPLTFSSSDESVSTVAAGSLVVVGAGTTVITASQEGSNVYLPAESIQQTLIVRDTRPPRLDLKAFYESLPDKTVSIDATPIEGITEKYDYQWFFNGFPIPEFLGGTTAVQVINGIEASEGKWKVVVTNRLGKAEHSFDYRILVDTDEDGLSDGYEELVVGTNPELPDTDGDGLNDFDEIETHNTDPLRSDSDGDGFLDGFELANKSAPLVASSQPNLTLEMALSDINGLPALKFETSPIVGGLITIEQSSDLKTWAPVVFFNGEGVAYETTVIRPPAAKNAYRLKVLDQTQ
ncbi:immunoglobulin domain-containing protein [bacterium]|nr:immunoglobulin domain-containing protein [bacterium]